jgi:hypothetical protein
MANALGKLQTESPNPEAGPSSKSLEAISADLREPSIAEEQLVVFKQIHNSCPGLADWFVVEMKVTEIYIHRKL